MRNRPFPNYPDDADYTTNTPSYYDDLARKNKLIELLSKRIWEYDEELAKRFDAWDKNLEDLPEDLKVLLQNWLDDGTLDHIINDTIFNWKLDTTIFEQFRDETTTEIPLDKYKHLYVGNDYTQALKKALEDAPDGATIIFNPNDGHILSEPFIINKPVTIDFNNTTTELSVHNEIVFDLAYASERDFKNRIELINYAFKGSAGFVPTKIIRINDTINTRLDGSMERCVASHSLIHNWKGYGTRIFGEFRYNQSPRGIYFSHFEHPELSVGEYSFDFEMNIDMTSHVGLGVEVEGGAGRIAGVIEFCSEGGYFYNGVGICVGVTLEVHFEGNKLFDMQIGTDETSEGGTRNQGITNILGSFFSRSAKPEKSIVFGKYQTINVIGSYLSDVMKPISLSTSDCSISCFGNFQTFQELDDDVAFNRFINFTSIHRGNTRTGNIIANLLEVGQHVQTPRVVYDNTFSIRKKGATEDVLLLTGNSILPTHLTTEFGSKWNAFSNVFSRYMTLQSPDGNMWQVSVSNTGELSAVII